MFSPLSSRVSSKVQVEITFENPVVFAGQSVNAVITFKNTNEPTSNDEQANGSKLASPGSTNRTRINRAMSARVSSAPRTGSIESPLSPVSPRNHDLPALVIPSSSTESSSGSSVQSPAGMGTIPVIKSVDTTYAGEEESPTTPTWESRLSMHLANSFRDMYWSSNASTPDFTNDATPNTSLLSPYRSTNSGNGSRWGVHQPTRSGTNVFQSQRAAQTQSLLMGYVQTQGYFVVDEDIIEKEQFSHVRTQGVVVGPNGGIGYKSQNNSGLLQGLASGLGSLLQIRDGDGNSSSEGLSRRLSFGRNSARPSLGRSNSRLVNNNSKNDAIPIFSTPQSLLFVDLKLAPGESKSFTYSLQLPKELPPSCRAKSIRIHYNLVIGIQKLDSRGRPQPRTTLVPFRVFPYVDVDGSQFEHNLLAPIVLQKDEATVAQISSDKRFSLEKVFKRSEPTKVESSEEEKKMEDFIKDLLDGKQQLLTQEQDSLESKFNSFSQDNIEYLCRFQDTISGGKPLRTRFDIGRSRKRIATVILSKPIYRVGENIVLIVDYSQAALKCFHITASLETEESISKELLKKTSMQDEIFEITRRVYSQSTMSSYSLNRSTFEFTIPATATPQFSTSSITLKWTLKLDFITSPSDFDSPVPMSATVSDDPETVSASYSRPTINSNNSSNNNTLLSNNSDTSLPRRDRRASSYRHRSISSLSSSSSLNKLVDYPEDPRSPLTVLHVSEQGMVNGTKETIACESFHCKIPICVMPTNQDIGALLEHTVSATRLLNM